MQSQFVSIVAILGLLLPAALFAQQPNRQTAEDVLQFYQTSYNIPTIYASVVTSQGVAWTMSAGSEKNPQELLPAPPISDLMIYLAVIEQLRADGAILTEQVDSDLIPNQFKLVNEGNPLLLASLLRHQRVLQSSNEARHDVNDPSVGLSSKQATFSLISIQVASAWAEKKSKRKIRELIDGLAAGLFVYDSKDSIAPGARWAHDGRTEICPFQFEENQPLGEALVSRTTLMNFFIAMTRPETPRQLELSKSLSDLRKLYDSQSSQNVLFEQSPRLPRLSDDDALVITASHSGYTSTIAINPRAYAASVVIPSENCEGLIERLARDLILVATKGEKPMRQKDLPKDLAQSLVGQWRGGDALLEIYFCEEKAYLRDKDSIVTLRGEGDRFFADGRQGSGAIIQFEKGATEEDDRLQFAGTTYQRNLARPAPVKPEWKPLIGKYVSQQNELYVLEWNGILELMENGVTMLPLEELPLEENGIQQFRVDSGPRAGKVVEFLLAKEGVADSLLFDAVRYQRVDKALAGDDATFKIKPRTPIDIIRQEAMEAEPPKFPGAPAEGPPFVDLQELDSTNLKFDIRYATTNNFMGSVFYQQPKAFLRHPAANSLQHVLQDLKTEDLGLVVYDAYRPWYVTKMFWDATPDRLRHFVADPSGGSRHNRGAAVDVGLVDLNTGNVLAGTSGYDEFNETAYPLFPGGTTLQRWSRDKLRRAMERHGFTVYPYEWWHFDHGNWKNYPVENLSFAELKQRE